jgi:hypothetical protein
VALEATAGQEAMKNAKPTVQQIQALNLSVERGRELGGRIDTLLRFPRS